MEQQIAQSILDPLVWQVDALPIDWDTLYADAYSPTVIITHVLAKIAYVE